MIAKAKAVQVMIALGISAITYTVYQNASTREENGKNATVNIQSMTPAIQPGKETKKKPESENEIETPKAADQVPGYGNPEEYVR